MDDQSSYQQPADLRQENSSGFKSFLSRNKYLIITIAILSCISFGTTGYLLLAKDKSPSEDDIQVNNIKTPSPTPLLQITISNTPMLSTPTPTVALTNPTATWSAFTSSRYFYSLKYPPGWTAQITTQTDPKILEYVVFNPVATKAGTLSITLSYGTRTNLEALALDPQVGETITVASVSATKKNSKDSNGNTAANIIVPVESSTIIFNAKNVFSSLFNQMLTTLKLTN
jgi:hypothetical protein